jgi:predicted MFS family arabinose efflux permease
VPATTAITANVFGLDSIGTLSGWIYFSHQVGAALGGWIFEATGSYSWAFISGALLAFLAAAMALAIKEEPVHRTPRPAPASIPAVAR